MRTRFRQGRSWNVSVEAAAESAGTMEWHDSYYVAAAAVVDDGTVEVSVLASIEQSTIPLTQRHQREWHWWWDLLMRSHDDADGGIEGRVLTLRLRLRWLRSLSRQREERQCRRLWQPPLPLLRQLWHWQSMQMLRILAANGGREEQQVMFACPQKDRHRAGWAKSVAHDPPLRLRIHSVSDTVATEFALTLDAVTCTELSLTNLLLPQSTKAVERAGADYLVSPARHSSAATIAAGQTGRMPAAASNAAFAGAAPTRRDFVPTAQGHSRLLPL